MKLFIITSLAVKLVAEYSTFDYIHKANSELRHTFTQVLPKVNVRMKIWSRNLDWT
jgi:hypothetical protein